MNIFEKGNFFYNNSFQIQHVKIVEKSDTNTITNDTTQIEPSRKWNTLNGYDASMRRHAAACEAGR
ncbi:MAG TPA: hypothetical protein VNX68_19755 [Nitrosopumilaceae archaeon]|jgi:hypothetical protein|nr:hypothetical protein [Nitrosopumilaceae archaeon]